MKSDHAGRETESTGMELEKKWLGVGGREGLGVWG